MKLAYLALILVGCAPVVESPGAQDPNGCSMEMLPQTLKVPPGSVATAHRGWPIVHLVCIKGKWEPLKVYDLNSEARPHHYE